MQEQENDLLCCRTQKKLNPTFNFKLGVISFKKGNFIDIFKGTCHLKKWIKF